MSRVRADRLTDRAGTGAPLFPNGAIVTGIITATTFVGDGSGLTGAGSTVSDDTTTDSTFYPLFTATTSGTVTDSKVSTTKLSFNPSTGTLNATTFVGDGSQLTGTGVGTETSINTSGIITATSFFGDGSGLTGAGSTVGDDTTTNETFYPLFTQTTSGTVTGTKVSTTKLSFNPSSGTVSATTFSGALSGNSTTASTLQTTRTINGVSFNGGSSIIVNPSSGAYSNGYGARTIQSGGTASGGSPGDIYYIY